MTTGSKAGSNLTPRLQLQLIESLLAKGEVADALYLAHSLSHTMPRNSALLAQLAYLLSHLQDYENSSRLYRDAIRISPRDATLRYSFAAVLRIIGDLDAAERQLDQAIALNPDDAAAWLLRSGLRVQTEKSNHISGLKQQIVRTGLSIWSEVTLRYALAKELEDIGSYRDSFTSLKQGADLLRRHIDYDLQVDLDVLDEIPRAFAAEFFYEKSAQGYETIEPIFLVGLPRAGSTLVERILGCSPGVHLAGELTR